MMIASFEKYCPNHGDIYHVMTDDLPYGNGAGWEASMIKLNYIRYISNLDTSGFTDQDYILCADSDVVFTSSEVFSYIHTYGIIGIKNATNETCAMGELIHMSGCAIFLRGDIVKMIASIPTSRLNDIRKRFKDFNLVENEDVVISYLAQMCGATYLNLPAHLYSDDLERDYLNCDLKSFYHMNYMVSIFLNHVVSGKWEIPLVLKRLRIEL